MTDAPDLEPAAVTDAATALVNFAWSAVVTDCTEAAEYLNELVGNLRAALASSPAPTGAEPVACPHDYTEHEPSKRYKFCRACNSEINACGFLVASPQPIAGLRRMSDAHREHAQSAVEHNATLNRLLSIAEARADRLEAEAADLRRKLEEAEQKAERQWEGWVREEAVRKAADRKLEEAREALGPFKEIAKAEIRADESDSTKIPVRIGFIRAAARTLSGASE